jgi:hypothetical protein
MRVIARLINFACHTASILNFFIRFRAIEILPAAPSLSSNIFSQKALAINLQYTRISKKLI